MANNTNYNKVIYNGKTLIDLTEDTAGPSQVLSGYTFHDKSGAAQEGSCTYDANTSGDTATAADILSAKTAHVKGSLITGTMTNNGSVTGSITTKGGSYTIPKGYHDGTGKVTIGISEQTKTATPSASSQTITPDSNKYLSSVTVNAIPYSEEDNTAGGITVTIG